MSQNHGSSCFRYVLLLMYCHMSGPISCSVGNSPRTTTMMPRRFSEWAMRNSSSYHWLRTKFLERTTTVRRDRSTASTICCWMFSPVRKSRSCTRHL